MSEYVVLQVANTRFAVKCAYPGFNEWLSNRVCGFMSAEEPHVKLSLSLNSVPESKSWGISEDIDPSRFLSIRLMGNGKEEHELKISMTSPHPEDLFWLSLQCGLRLGIPAKRPLDLLLHAAGVVREGFAYLFTGSSGAGKSTVCRLLEGNGDFIILHDDMVALSQSESGFRVWSTPLGGEMPASSSISAPLRAIFFLIQDKSTYATKVSGWQTMHSLIPQMLPPLTCKNGDITIDPAESLKMLLAMAGTVPSYELHFRPDLSFWRCIEQLPFREIEASRSGQGA